MATSRLRRTVVLGTRGRGLEKTVVAPCHRDGAERPDFTRGRRLEASVACGKGRSRRSCWGGSVVLVGYRLGYFIQRGSPHTCLAVASGTCWAVENTRNSIPLRFSVLVGEGRTGRGGGVDGLRYNRCMSETSGYRMVAVQSVACLQQFRRSMIIS